MFKRLMSKVRKWKWARRYIRPWYVRFGKSRYMRTTDAERHSLVELVEALPGEGQLVMIEVGSYRGESAEIFLGTNRFSRIYCIDPWKGNYDSNDWSSFTNMAEVERDFDKRVGGDGRIVKVKGTIDTFLEQYPDVEVDFAYVDGCHTYEAVKYDLQKVMANRRPRVAVGGHDYCDKDWEGVRRAIEECIGRPDARFADTSWVKFL